MPKKCSNHILIMPEIKKICGPKGHIAVYVGESEMKRYVVPLTYLSHPSYKDLLRRHAEEQYGYNHPFTQWVG